MGVDPYSTEGMFVALDEARAKREKIMNASAPERAEREKLLASIGPLEAKLREVNAAIRAKHTDLYDTDQQIANLTKALSGRQDPRKVRAEQEAAAKAAG